MAIETLSKTSSDQVRKLLEDCGVKSIKERAGRFDIECPSCQKTEAFIEYRYDKRWIKCNRNNNCAYNQSLWDLIAEKQGILESDKVQMLEYINYILGQNFIKTERKEPVTHSVQESVIKDQEFLNHCNQIFKNSFQQKNSELKVSLEYLKNRGYSDEHIQSFNLGYLPSFKDLLKSLIASPYNYEESKVEQLVNKYFGSILKWNSSNYGREEQYNNIGFTWYDKNNNVAGFSFRKPTDQNVEMKYVYNKGCLRSKVLFNINNYQLSSKKQIVIVEGTFDALAASYLSSKEVQDNYFFIAMGGNSLTEGQVQILEARGISDVILLIDKDDAGSKYQSSVQKLNELNITASIARIPTKYTNIKDIDELLRKYQKDNNIFMEILNNAEKTEANTKQLKEGQAIDLHHFKRKIDEQKKSNLLNEINKEIATGVFSKEFIQKSKQYNDLLSVNYEEDEAYTTGGFLQDLQNSPRGLKTGFKGLDGRVVIQPSTLNFVAGRPSHGKTTVMLNMLRNMIRSNPDKAFMFYSYEESHVDIYTKILLSCTQQKDLEIDSIENSESSYFDKTKEHLIEYAVAIKTNAEGKPQGCAEYIYRAYQEVESWVKEGRLHIMTRKPNVESLSGAIIERVTRIENKKQDALGKIQLDGKKVAAIFIDYVQKLNCEEDKSSRQQELHKVCKDLLNTACDKRVESSIIMGAQANREVKSLETFLLENMREAGDIEQDANVVIGVWDEGAGEQARLQQKLAEAEDKAEDQELGKKHKSGINYKKIVDNIKKKQEELKSQKDQQKPLTLKVLKNRNGKNNFDCTIMCHADRFCVIKSLDTKDKINEFYQRGIKNET
jgi:replicative DNA helicase